MSLMPFIPKENQSLPDHYGLTFIYHDGSKEQFSVAQHRMLPSHAVEFATKDDKWNVVPFTSFRRLEFDGNFSKVIAIREKQSVKVS